MAFTVQSEWDKEASVSTFVPLPQFNDCNPFDIAPPTWRRFPRQPSAYQAKISAVSCAQVNMPDRVCGFPSVVTLVLRAYIQPANRLRRSSCPTRRRLRKSRTGYTWRDCWNWRKSLTARRLSMWTLSVRLVGPLRDSYQLIHPGSRWMGSSANRWLCSDIDPSSVSYTTGTTPTETERNRRDAIRAAFEKRNNPRLRNLPSNRVNQPLAPIQAAPLPQLLPSFGPGPTSQPPIHLQALNQVDYVLSFRPHPTAQPSIQPQAATPVVQPIIKPEPLIRRRNKPSKAQRKRSGKEWEQKAQAMYERVLISRRVAGKSDLLPSKKMLISHSSFESKLVEY